LHLYQAENKTMKTLLALLSAVLISSALYGQNYDSKSSLPGTKKAGDADRPKTTRSAVENVIIVYKTHFDIGYSSSVHDVVHEYRTEMVDRVLEAIEENSQQPRENQFVWTVSGWPMKQMLWEGQAPDRRLKIEQAIRDGNLVVHAYPFTTHTETAEMEDLVRGLNISSKISRQFGQPLSVSAKMSDVPGQSWFTPTLFTHAGIKFYHMGGPVVNMEHGLPMMFWWEGPDGSRLLTLYHNGYGSEPMPPENWPYKTWVYINMTGDNQGPPGPETINKDLAFYKERGVKARAGSMDDFANLILQEDLGDLPVVRSDIGDVWIHGAMSQPAATKMAQNIRPDIGGADILTTIENCWGIFRPDISGAISRAYEKSMLYSEHTWGLANQHFLKIPYGPEWDAFWAQGLPPQYVMMEKSWKDQADFAYSVQQLVTEPYADAIATLADNVSVQGPRIVVYNPLPWTRGGEVFLDTRTLGSFNSLKPADGGPAVLISREYPSLENPAPVTRFFVSDIPSMGYRTFIASKEMPVPIDLIADEQAGVIESPWFKATFDAKRGRISSLIDKRSGRELVDQSAPQGFGQYLYERFGYKDLSDWLVKSLYPQYVAHRFCFVAYDMPKDSVYRSALPENMTLALRKTPIDVTAVMTGTIPGPGQPQKISIRLTLPAGSPVADLEVSWQKQPDGWPEAGWICLPFKMDNPRFRLGRLGADMDPVKDFTVDNSNFHMSWINTGVAVLDGNSGGGVGICPEDSPVVSLGMPGEYQFSKRYEPSKPYVYINLYNNHWRTNFVAWIGNGERMSSRVRLWSFDRYNSESALYTPAMESRVPLKFARSRSNPGTLPVTQAGITLSGKGIALTAFGPNPDGNGTVLRLWEQSGTTRTVNVTLPAGSGFISATPVNLRGEKSGEPFKIVNGQLSATLQKYGPASFILH
jgi:alpha-mannosidase